MFYVCRRYDGPDTVLISISFATYRREWQLGKVRPLNERKKEIKRNWWGCVWLVSDRGILLSSNENVSFTSHISCLPLLMSSTEGKKREMNSEGKKFSFCQIGEARREDDPRAKGFDTASIPLGVSPAGLALDEDYFSHIWGMAALSISHILCREEPCMLWILSCPVN